MKQLFSPWRSQYIETFKEPKKERGCLFCRMAKQKPNENNLIVHHGKSCYVIMNKYPYNSGHLLIVPYRHLPGFSDLNENERLNIMNVSSKCFEAIMKRMKPQGFNFGANIGRAAGAGIDKHIHFHIVPRWNGDTNFMPVLSETKLISEEMKKTWKELKKALNQQSKGFIL